MCDERERVIAIVGVLGAPRKKQGSPLSKFPSFVWGSDSDPWFFLSQGRGFWIDNFEMRVPLPFLVSPTTTGLSLTGVSPRPTPPDRKTTVWSLSNGEHSGACAVGETALFGNGYSEAQNPVEDRKNGYGGGIWCGHDASEIRGETQLLLPTLPDTHNSVASVPTRSLLPLSLTVSISCYSYSYSYLYPYSIINNTFYFTRLPPSIFAPLSQPNHTKIALPLAHPSHNQKVRFPNWNSPSTQQLITSACPCKNQILHFLHVPLMTFLERNWVTFA